MILVLLQVAQVERKQRIQPRMRMDDALERRRSHFGRLDDCGLVGRAERIGAVSGFIRQLPFDDGRIGRQLEDVVQRRQERRGRRSGRRVILQAAAAERNGRSVVAVSRGRNDRRINQLRMVMHQGSVEFRRIVEHGGHVGEMFVFAGRLLLLLLRRILRMSRLVGRR